MTCIRQTKEYKYRLSKSWLNKQINVRYGEKRRWEGKDIEKGEEGKGNLSTSFTVDKTSFNKNKHKHLHQHGSQFSFLFSNGQFLIQILGFPQAPHFQKVN